MRPPALAPTLTLAACLAWGSVARAQAQGQGPQPSPGSSSSSSATTEMQAHAAYERGTAAYRRHDYATAEREYAAADALAPNPVALQAALDAAVLADDPVLGTQLLERARGARRGATRCWRR